MKVNVIGVMFVQPYTFVTYSPKVAEPTAVFARLKEEEVAPATATPFEVHCIVSGGVPAIVADNVTKPPAYSVLEVDWLTMLGGDVLVPKRNFELCTAISLALRALP